MKSVPARVLPLLIMSRWGLSSALLMAEGRGVPASTRWQGFSHTNGWAGTDSDLRGASVQNIPFGLARGMFGAINGAELFGSPTTCKVSQCSTALPSASIL
jgi:hypothetical protein